MRIPFHWPPASSTALSPYLRRRGAAADAVAFAVFSAASTAHKQRCYVDYGRTETTSEESVVVVMGATGTGKSKLSVDLATRFRGEVVNSDKIQVYRGLDVTTNKIPLADRRGVPHHLLGTLDPRAGELTPGGFRSMASSAIASITARGRLPVMAGGSNSFIHAALARKYVPECDPFSEGRRLRQGSSQEDGLLRYRCCLLWVDVEAELLAQYLDRRVEEMVAEGMVNELERYYAAEGPAAMKRHPGLGKAIGVSEFEGYFVGEEGRRWKGAEYEKAVAAIKESTRRLAGEQMRKIKRLEELGWELRRVDATAAVAARMAGGAGEGTAATWESDVLRPSVAAVERFLEEYGAAGTMDVAAARAHPKQATASRASCTAAIAATAPPTATALSHTMQC